MARDLERAFKFRSRSVKLRQKDNYFYSKEKKCIKKVVPGIKTTALEYNAFNQSLKTQIEIIKKQIIEIKTCQIPDLNTQIKDT